MSGQGGVVTDLNDEVAFSPAGPTAAPHKGASQNPPDDDSVEEDEELEEEEEEEEEEEVTSSAHLEPCTLPWPGDKDKKPLTDTEDGVWSERGASKPEERDLSEDRDLKTKWRESMPEGERWGDDEEEDDEEEDEEPKWISEKAALSFTPHVTIVCPSSQELPEESGPFAEETDRLVTEPDPAVPFRPEWTDEDDGYYLCEQLCGERLRLILATVAAGILFPLLVWGGYALLPFDSPLLESAPLRVVYTLRCSFFAIVPILLGVVVQGVARLRYSVLKPLYQNKLVNWEVAVHWHYVNESLALFLFYFLQLAVMASYVSQDLVKLVPLLTIVFVFGRLIYWLCLSLGSSIRGLGFGLSFLPILVMLGANLYYVCSSVGEGAVFDVARPTAAAPPPERRWWG
ncbi:transmembrane protein 79-like isoform X1 [Embiotoca jacksoni]|uniref:transmembrane protein 79-like isoform X1 n=1 Tax=Embiotoca jacksoni TaxID=100190 RepID=UPI0037046C21